MEAAKSSVKKFMSKSGHHDTEVHEQVAPAVEHETVSQTQHEKQTTAVDKEVHQDHYHVSEQPIQHSETKPEQHHHKIIPTEHRKFEHDDAEEVKRKVAAEQGKYQHESQRVEGERTASSEPTVAGEHVHHHVHETIQPVVNKQTVEPHVVHTTVPVHEVHHNAAQHHSSSALPAMSMEDFKKQGGSLSGRDVVSDKFDGAPEGDIAGHRDHRHGGLTSAGAGAGAAGAAGGAAAASDSSATKSASSGQSNGISGGSSDGPLNSSKHAGLKDKLNPKVDADGDGKQGVMS